MVCGGGLAECYAIIYSLVDPRGGGADCLLTQTKTKNHHTSDPAPNFWNKMILGHFLDILVNFHWIPDWLPEGTGY